MKSVVVFLRLNLCYPSPVSKRISVIGSTTPTASWRDDELMAFARDFLVAGVIPGIGNAFAVVQHAAGANMSVDVGYGRSIVNITNTNLTPSKTYNVWFDCETDTSTATTVNIAAADPTNPRIDIVCAKVDVSQNPDTSAGNIASIIVVTGTPAGSPSAPATPANCLLLANIAVAAGATSVVTANITDKRVFVKVVTTALQEVTRQGLGNIIAAGSGTNTVTASYTPKITALVDGMILGVVPANTNTGALTFNPDGLGAAAVKKYGATDLASGDWQAKVAQLVQYSATDTNWKLISGLGQAAGSGSVVSLAKRDVKSTQVSTTSTSFVDIDATNWTVDVVCTANTILVLFLVGTCSGTATLMSFDFTIAGTRISGGSNGLIAQNQNTANASPLSLIHVVQPGAGTKTIRPQFLVNSGTGTFGNTGSIYPTFAVLKIEP